MQSSLLDPEFLHTLGMHAISDSARAMHQARAGYSGTPDSDPNPTFSQVASNLAITGGQLTVKLPAASLTVLAF